MTVVSMNIHIMINYAAVLHQLSHVLNLLAPEFYI